MSKVLRTAARLVLVALICVVVPALNHAGTPSDESGLRSLDVAELWFTAGSTSELAWSTAASATSYGLYRGRIRPGGFRPRVANTVNHRCLATEIPEPLGVDRKLPQPGEAFYYLVQGLNVNHATHEIAAGSLGAGREEGRAACGERYYIDPDATGTGTGLSWADALTSMSAINDIGFGHGRSYEFWVRGALVEDDVLQINKGDSAFLGGFAGNEQRAWERRPDLHESSWSRADGQGALLSLWEEGVFVVDGMTLRGARTGILNEGSGERWIEVYDSRFEGLGDEAIKWVVHIASALPNGFLVHDSRFSGGHDAIFVATDESDGVVEVARSTFESNTGDAITVRTTADFYAGRSELEIVANRITGGERGIFVRAWDSVTRDSQEAQVEGLIANNVIANSSQDAIALNVEATTRGTAPGWSGIKIDILHNTIIDPGDDGIACVLDAGIPIEPPPAETPAYCTPRLMNNLIVGAAGYGVHESADDPAESVFGDFVLVGNDLHDNLAPYLDEGTTPLSIAELNLIDGNRANYDLDPLLEAGPQGPYYPAAHSPAIDRAEAHPTIKLTTDIDGKARERDGDGDGTARADTGAAER